MQDVDAFQRDGLRPNGSPAEMVIQDLIRQALTVDQLFVMLRSMGHAAAMKLLLDYGEELGVGNWYHGNSGIVIILESDTQAWCRISVELEYELEGSELHGN